MPSAIQNNVPRDEAGTAFHSCWVSSESVPPSRADDGVETPFEEELNGLLSCIYFQLLRQQQSCLRHLEGVRCLHTGLKSLVYRSTLLRDASILHLHEAEDHLHDAPCTGQGGGKRSRETLADSTVLPLSGAGKDFMAPTCASSPPHGLTTPKSAPVHFESETCGSPVYRCEGRRAAPFVRVPRDGHVEPSPELFLPKSWVTRPAYDRGPMRDMERIEGSPLAMHKADQPFSCVAFLNSALPSFLFMTSPCQLRTYCTERLQPCYEDEEVPWTMSHFTLLCRSAVEVGAALLTLLEALLKGMTSVQALYVWMERSSDDSASFQGGRPYGFLWLCFWQRVLYTLLEEVSRGIVVFLHASRRLEAHAVRAECERRDERTAVARQSAAAASFNATTAQAALAALLPAAETDESCALFHRSLCVGVPEDDRRMELANANESSDAVCSAYLPDAFRLETVAETLSQLSDMLTASFMW